MSVDISLVKSCLPQEGSELVTDADITAWGVAQETAIKAINSGVTGNDLNHLLFLKCVERGRVKMGYTPEPYSEDYNRYLKMVLSRLVADKPIVNDEPDSTINILDSIPWVL